MLFIDLVRARESARDYAQKAVPREVINRCLEAARLAPSACNCQPWHFIVVDEAGLRKKLAEAAFGGIYSLNAFAKNAAVLVVVIREATGCFARMGGFFRGIEYGLIDIGISCQHFILQAQEEGVGTCWLGWFNSRAVKKVLGIAAGKKAEIIISMGYPQSQAAGEKKRKPLEEISSFNEYRGWLDAEKK